MKRIIYLIISVFSLILLLTYCSNIKENSSLVLSNLSIKTQKQDIGETVTYPLHFINREEGKSFLRYPSVDNCLINFEYTFTLNTYYHI